jgi:hypothetical protein
MEIFILNRIKAAELIGIILILFVTNKILMENGRKIIMPDLVGRLIDVRNDKDEIYHLWMSWQFSEIFRDFKLMSINSFLLKNVSVFLDLDF